MKNRFQHIAASFLMLIFLSYAVGIEVSQHTCKAHGTQSIALFGVAKCQCENESDALSDNENKVDGKCCEQNKSSETEESDNSCCSSENSANTENNQSETQSDCCDKTPQAHDVNYPEFSDDCCVELHHSFSIEDSYTVTIIEKPNPNFSVLYCMPVENDIYKSVIKSTNILNLARDVGIQNRQSIIQYLHNNSNPNKSDDISIALA